MFLTWFAVLEASFHMTWDMTSTWSSEAFGAQRTGPGKPWTSQNSDIYSVNWRQRQQQGPPEPLPARVSERGAPSAYSTYRLR